VTRHEFRPMPAWSIRQRTSCFCEGWWHGSYSVPSHEQRKIQLLGESTIEEAAKKNNMRTAYCSTIYS
jgi:hypothetical protein